MEQLTEERPCVNKRFAAVANLAFSSSHAIFTIVTGLLMVPVYLHHFNMATYGAWLASGNVIAMIALIEPGISTVATQRLAASYAADEKRRFANIFGSAFLLSVGFGVVVIVAGLCLAPFIPAWLNAPSDQRYSLSVALCFSTLGAGISFTFYLLGAVPQAWQRTVAPGVIGLFALTANIVAILAGLYYDLGVVALGLGSLALSSIYVLGYLVYIIVMWGRLEFPRPTASMATALEIWHEAKMLLLAKIAGTIGKYLEAPAAALAVSTEAAAVLILTGRVLNAVQMFADRVGTAVFAGMAHSFASFREGADYKVMKEVIIISTVISGLGIGFSLALSEPIINLWVGKNAFGGLNLLLLLSLSSFVSSRKDIVSTILVANGQIRQASVWLAIEALVRVLFITLLAVIFKVPGIPLAAALASLVAIVGLSRVLLAMPGLPRDMLYLPGIKGCAISILLGMTYMYFAPNISSWPELAVHSVLFGAVMLLANMLDKEWSSVLQQTFVATFKTLRVRRGTI